jgi:hypothetical protein
MNTTELEAPLASCKWVKYCTHSMDGVKLNVLNPVTRLNMTCVKCGSKEWPPKHLMC